MIEIGPNLADLLAGVAIPFLFLIGFYLISRN